MILNVLSASLSMSAVIFFLVLMRKHINKKYSARVMCTIWLFVALRLLIPVEIDLPVSKLHLELNMDQVITEVDLSAIEIPEFNNTIQLNQTIKVEETVIPAANFSISWLDVVTCVWIAGALFMLVKQVLAYCSISKWLKRNSVYEKTVDGFKVYLSSVLPEPLSFGTFKSSIYLSEQVKTDNWILSHELMHCKHYDGLMMWIAALMKSIHWFNPLVYWMDKQWEADRELYCDEAVLKDKTKAERVEYMVTLYDAAEAMTNQRLRFASRLLNGGSSMKERIQKAKSNSPLKRGRILTVLLSIMMIVSSGLIGCSKKEENKSEDLLLMQMMSRIENKDMSIEALILEGPDWQMQNDGSLLECYHKSFHTIQFLHPEYNAETGDYVKRVLEKKGILKALNDMNAQEIEQFEVTEREVIVQIIQEGMRISFYNDGVMKLTSKADSGLQKTGYYTVNLDGVKHLQNVVLEEFARYWTRGAGVNERERDSSLNDVWQIKKVLENDLEILKK